MFPSTCEACLTYITRWTDMSMSDYCYMPGYAFGLSIINMSMSGLLGEISRGCVLFSLTI